MTKEEFALLIELAFVLRGIAAPDDQRSIDRHLNALQDPNDAGDGILGPLTNPSVAVEH